MKRYVVRLLVGMVILVLPGGVVAKSIGIVFPFSTENLQYESQQLYAALQEIRINNMTVIGIGSVRSFNSLLDLATKDAIETINKYAIRHKVHYILFSELSHSLGEIMIEYKLYSREINGFISTSFDWVPYTAVYNSAKNFAKRLLLIENGAILKIVNVSALADSVSNAITVYIDRYGDIDSCAILRSLFKEGPYDTIAVTNESQYTDTQVQQGIVYWYKVHALKDGVIVDISNPTSVYVPITGNNITDLDKILAQYKQPEEKPLNEEHKQLMKRHLDLIKPLYMNSVKLRIILHIVKSHIAKKQLVVLRDFDSVLISPDTSTVYFIKKNAYVVKLESEKPFTLFKESNYDTELMQRLLLQAIAFGIPEGTIECIDEEGFTVQLPLYQSIGVATTYFKEYKHWQSNTILWSTQNKELKEKMKEYAQQ